MEKDENSQPQEELNQVKIVTKSLQSNEVRIQEPENDGRRDLRQLLRNISSKKDIGTNNITMIDIPQDAKNDRLYDSDTPIVEEIYNFNELNSALSIARTSTASYYKQLNRITIRSISSKESDKYINNLEQYNLSIAKLGRADRVPGYLKLANKINISTLRELNKINKFNRFFNKNYIIEQSEYIKKQDIYNKSLIGTLNNLGKMLNQKLETIKINTSIGSMHKSSVKDIRQFNFRSWIAKKQAELMLYGISKSLSVGGGVYDARQQRREEDDVPDKFKDKVKNSLEDIQQSFKDRIKEIIVDADENLTKEKLKEHLRGGEGSGDTVVTSYTETIKENTTTMRKDIKAIRNFLETGNASPLTPGSTAGGSGGRSPTEGSDGSDRRFSDAIDMASHFFSNIGGKARDKFYTQRVANFKKTATDISTNLFENTKKMNKKDVLEKLSNMLNESKDAIKGIDRKEFLKYAKDKLKDIKEIDKNIITDIIQGFIENQTLKDAKWTIKRTIDENLYESKGNMFLVHPEDQKSKKDRNKIRNQLNKSLNKAKEITPEFITKLFEDVDTSDLSEEEMEAFNKLKEETSNKFQDKFKAMKEYLEDVSLNDIQEDVTQFMIANKEQLKNLSKEDLKKFVTNSLKNIQQLDKEQIKTLTTNLSKDIYGKITTQGIRHSLEHNFKKLKIEERAPGLIETLTFKKWRDRQQEDLEMRAMSDNEQVAASARFHLKLQEKSKEWVSKGTGVIGKSIGSGLNVIGNQNFMKSKFSKDAFDRNQSINEYNDIFKNDKSKEHQVLKHVMGDDINNMKLHDILTKYNTKEAVAILNNMLQENVTEYAIEKYKKENNIKVNRKGRKKTSEDINQKLEQINELKNKEKGEYGLENLKHILESRGLSYEEVLSGFTAKECADLFNELGYEDITGSDVNKYRRRNKIRVRRKVDKDELAYRVKEALKDKGFVERHRDNVVDSGINLFGGTRTAIQRGISKLPWTKDFDDEDAERRSQDREEIKKDIKLDLDDVGRWGKRTASKPLKWGVKKVQKITGRWTGEEEEDIEEETPTTRDRELQIISNKLLKDLVDELSDTDLDQGVIESFIRNKDLKDIRKQPESRDAVLKDLVDKIRRKKVSISIAGFNTGLAGRAVRKGVSSVVGPVWRGGREVNKARKAIRDEWKYKRADKLRQEIKDILQSSRELGDMDDEYIDSFIDQKELLSIVTIGPVGWSLAKLTWRRNRYIKRIMEIIVKERSQKNDKAKELYDRIKKQGFFFRRNKLKRELKSTERNKENADNLREEIKNELQDADSSITDELIDKYLNTHVNENDLLKYSKRNYYNVHRWRYKNKIFKKIVDEHTKDERRAISDVGKLKKKSRGFLLTGHRTRKWQLGKLIRKKSRLKREGRSDDEIQEIMDGERNETLDKINKGIDKAVSFLKPKKKDPTDKDGDGDDDKSYFDKDEDKEVDLDEDGNPIEKKEDESKSLLSKIGKFMGPISSIFGGVASALGGTISMLGGIASGALSLVGGIAGTLGSIGAYLGLRKLGMGAIGAKLAVLVTKLKGLKVPGTSGWLGKAGKWLGAGAAGTWKGTKFLGRNIKNPKLILGGVGAGMLYSQLFPNKAEASESPDNENFDFSNIDNEFSQQPNMMNNLIDPQSDDPVNDFNIPDQTEGNNAKSSIPTLGDAASTGAFAALTIGGTKYKRNKAAMDAAAKVAKRKILTKMSMIGLKTGAKFFTGPIGWAWLAYDTYSLGSSTLTWLAEAKKNKQLNLYTPISLFYRESFPEFNKRLIGNLDQHIISQFIVDIKYSIMEETLKNLSNAKDLEDFRKKIKALKANTSIDKLEKNKAVKKLKKHLYKNIGKSYNHEYSARYTQGIQVGNKGKVNNTDIDKYVSYELNKIRMKNDLLIEYLSQVKHEIVIGKFYEVSKRENVYDLGRGRKGGTSSSGSQKKAFEELLMILFSASEFQKYIELNKEKVISIGRVFNEKEIEALIDGSLKIDEGSYNDQSTDYLNVPDIQTSDSDAKEENEPVGDKPSKLTEILGQGTMDRIEDFVKNIYGSENIGYTRERYSEIYGQSSTGTGRRDLDTFDPRGDRYGGTPGNNLQWGNTSKLPEDVDNRSGWQGLPINENGQVLTTYEIPGVKREGNHVSLQHLTDNIKACLVRLVRLFGTFTCNSGFRTPKYNDHVKGVKGSQHLLGAAVDLSIRGMNNKTKAFLLECGLKAGFSTFAIYETDKLQFIHFDLRPGVKSWRSNPSWAKPVIAALWRPGMSPTISEEAIGVEKDETVGEGQQRAANTYTGGQQSSNQTQATPASAQSNIDQQNSYIHQASFTPSTEGGVVDMNSSMGYLKNYRNVIKTRLSSMTVEELNSVGKQLMELANLNHDQSFLDEVSKEYTIVQKQIDKLKSGSSNPNLIKASFTDDETGSSIEPMKQSKFKKLDISDTTVITDEQLQVQHDYLQDIIEEKKQQYNAGDISARGFNKIRSIIQTDIYKIEDEQNNRRKNLTASVEIKKSLEPYKNFKNLDKLELEDLKGIIKNIKDLTGFTTDQTHLNEISKTLLPFEKEMKRRQDTPQTPIAQALTGVKDTIKTMSDTTSNGSAVNTGITNDISLPVLDKLKAETVNEQPTQKVLPNISRDTLSTNNILSDTYIRDMGKDNLKYYKNEYRKKLNEITQEYKAGNMSKEDYEKTKKNLETNIRRIGEQEVIINNEETRRTSLDMFGGSGRSLTKKEISLPTIDAFGGKGRDINTDKTTEPQSNAEKKIIDYIKKLNDQVFMGEISNEEYKRKQDRAIAALNDIKWREGIKLQEANKKKSIKLPTIDAFGGPGRDIYKKHETIDAFGGKGRDITPKDRTIDNLVREAMNYELDQDVYDPRSPTTHKTNIEPHFNMPEIQLRDKQFPNMTASELSKEKYRLREKKKTLNIKSKKSKTLEEAINYAHEKLNTVEKNNLYGLERWRRGNLSDVNLRSRDIHGVASKEDLSEVGKLKERLRIDDLEKQIKWRPQRGRDNLDKLENKKVQPRDIPETEDPDALDPRKKGPRDGIFGVKIDPDKYDPRNKKLQPIVNPNIDPDTGEETYHSTTDPKTSSSPVVINTNTGTRKTPEATPSTVPEPIPTKEDIPMSPEITDDSLDFNKICECMSTVKSSIDNLTNLITSKGIKVSNFEELKEEQNEDGMMSVEIKKSEVLDKIHNEIKMNNETSKKLLEQGGSSSNIKKVNPNLSNGLNTRQQPQKNLFNDNVTSI